MYPLDFPVDPKKTIFRCLKRRLPRHQEGEPADPAPSGIDMSGFRIL